MNEKIGEWMITEGIMDYQNVIAILEFQRHGNSKKFGELALSKQMINGKDLRFWESLH